MEEDKFLILPCSGLDKSLGQIARAAALDVIDENKEIEIICPVHLSADREKYTGSLQEKKLIIIDGCGARCASKLAAENKAKVAYKIYIPDEVKESGKKPGKELKLDAEAVAVSNFIKEKILNYISSKKEEKESQAAAAADWNEAEPEYLETMVDKFILKVPKSGYLFSENDSWAKVKGDFARIGVTDYLQTNAGDVMFVELPEIGTEIAQFDDACEIESGKAVLQIVSPVSGVITAVNEKLSNNPELLNESPYTDGWIVEVRLTDIEEDSELLIDGEKYFAIMEAKARKEIAGKH